MSGQADERGNLPGQHTGLFDAVNAVDNEEIHERRGTSGEFRHGDFAIQQNK